MTLPKLGVIAAALLSFVDCGGRAGQSVGDAGTTGDRMMMGSVGGANPGRGGGGGAGNDGPASPASGGSSGSGDARGSADGTAGADGAVAPEGGTDAGVPAGGNGFYRMERLDRGVVAVRVTGGNYVGWRMLGFEYDATNAGSVAYSVYRDGTRIAEVSNSTNLLDATGAPTARYVVRPVIGGVEGPASEPAEVHTPPYLRVPLQIPPPGNTPATCALMPGEAFTYTANDTSVGDLDGDGRYEIVVKWDPSNAKDNSQAGCTGNVIIDAYRIDGTRLWRLDLGPNIRAGAHYTQFLVYDFDGDGKAEMAVKTAPGTRDGTGQSLRLGPAANDDDTALHRNDATGYVLNGPEYLTVFSGQSGAEMATVNFDVARGTVGAWGDTYGNRVDRFLAAVAYLDGSGLPSLIMARGYYTRATMTAWNWRAGTLTQLWKFDSNVTPRDTAGRPYTGQGAHSMAVANVDDDLGQEIMYGAAAIDHDGKGLCSTGFGHGDAEHVGDLIPGRPGLEFFMCNEDGASPAYHLRDARTCAILQSGPINGADTGRCVADDVHPGSPGAEMWASSVDGLFSAGTNSNLGTKPSSQNFLIYWDADESRELLDRTQIDKYTSTTGVLTRLLTASGTASNNGTKTTPALTADIMGDWREEVIWREANDAALRIYTTTDVTARRIYTLMHDPQYRVQVASENTGYNQPPHPSFHIGNGMAAPPAPNIHVR